MLVDFGIAKVFDAGMQTTVGARALTPGYAPLEQYGKGKTDARTDLYALGATLYTVLTGERPQESVQRAIQDDLVPPERLNPKLSTTPLMLSPASSAGNESRAPLSERSRVEKLAAIHT